jgi:hypothetical protein
LVEEKELCRVKFPKGIVWPKNLQPNFFKFLFKGYLAWLLVWPKTRRMKGKKVVFPMSSTTSSKRNGG